MLAVLVPGLLMLATFGLERLEAALARDPDATADVPEFVQQAESERAKSLAQEAVYRETDAQHHLSQDRSSAAQSYAVGFDGPSLPTRAYVHHRPNPQFQAPRQADRV